MLKHRVVWHLEVTEHLDALLEDYIKLDSFKTKSEFIRNAVREKLESESAKIPRDQCEHARARCELSLPKRGGENDGRY